MKPTLLFLATLLLLTFGALAQNVFSPSDPIIRYNSTSALGSSERPDPAKRGLQKWVSTATNGVSIGSGAWDASTFKAYFFNLNGQQLVFRLKFPKTYLTNTTKRFPIMMFFNGAGENGCTENNGVYNNEKQLVNGGRFFRDKVDNGQFDGFLVYYQKQIPSGGDCQGYWGLSGSDYVPVIALLDSLFKYVRLDIDRVLVDGLSSGGGASFAIAAAYPRSITKIAPSASASYRPNIADYVHIPIWFATGKKDSNPTAATATNAYNNIKNAGANIRFTLYENLGHNVWNAHWQEPDFTSWMNDLHKANPLVYFGRSEFCQDSAVNARIGITAGYYAYEWQKDGVTIARRTNGTNTIVNGSSIISFTGNEITVKAYGTYKVRFQRTASSAWSEWSPKPAVIKVKGVTQTAPIAVSGARSKVLPAPDGSTNVPLTLPSGFTNYQWYRVSDNALVGSSQTYNAPVGQYKARYSEPYGCGTSFSPVFTVVNANGSPKPPAASNLKADSVGTTSIQLTWTNASTTVNETGFEIYRATQQSGPYTFITITNPDVTTYRDNSVTANTRYYYIVRAVNETGASANSNQAFAGNNAPVIGTINNMVVKTGNTSSQTFTVTDDAGDIVTVSIPNPPPFVSLSKVTATSFKVTASPSASHIGWYNVQVFATDNKGATRSKSFTLTVGDRNTRTVYVNFGNKAAPAPWNNWLGKRGAGNVLAGLKDETSLSSTFSIATLETWQFVNELGFITGNNSGVFPDTVLQGGIADTSAQRTIRLAGLNSSMRYNVMFVGSQNEGADVTSEYASGSQKAWLNARYNSNQTASLNGLIPNSSGQIDITIKRTKPNVLNYVNAIMIEEYAPTASLLAPANLFVEPVDMTTVILTWTDRMSNENASGGYSLEYATDASFTQNLRVVSLAANTTYYKCSGLASNTRYWFRVRAKAGTSNTGYSNSASFKTPEGIVYLNFNYTVPAAPTPWNNTQATPAAGISFNNLKNQSGLATGINVSIVRGYNGEFNAGMQTGNNSGVVPDRVLQSAYWLDRSQIAELRVTGLRTDKRYRFGFLGSSGTPGWFKGNYTATYSINGRIVYLNSWLNTSKIVYIDDIVPNAQGQVTILMSTTNNAAYGFNSGMIIHPYSDVINSIAVSRVNPDTTSLVNLAAPDEQPALTEPSFYPNPFNNYLNIDLYNPVSNSTIYADIIDMSGRLLTRKNFSGMPQGNVTLRMTGLEFSSKSEMYMISVSVNGEKVKTVKMMRRR